MPEAYSNPPRLTYADTILYEIYMLRFAAKRLQREQWESEEDAWVYLESYLTHYRNLIEFLGKPETNKKGRKNIRRDDLHISNIWKKLGISDPSDIDTIRRTGAALFKEFKSISKYLSHCTQKRIESKDWYIGNMTNGINSLLDKIEAALAPYGSSHFKRVPPIQFSGSHPANALLYTYTAFTASGCLPVSNLRLKQFE